MPDANIQKLSEEALRRLSEALEAGHSEVLKDYLAAMGQFHRYSWKNVLLIASQRPNATHVAGFHAWHALERSVKHGEKGIMIFAPMLVKARDAPGATEGVNRDAELRLSGFRTAYVFDVAQTQGKPLPEFAATTGDPKDYGEKLRGFVAQRGITVEYDAGIAPAQGISTGGRIRLVPGLSSAEEFSVLTHELAHEMLHHRKDGALPSKLVRETQAEAVAFVVCRGIGLDTNTAAADYIALYSGDEKTLAESLGVIRETSAEILSGLLPEQPRERADPAKSKGNVPDAGTPRSAPESAHHNSESIEPIPPRAGPEESVSLDR